VKFNRVTFKPFAEIEFSDEDLAVLMTCSKAHYDGYCKSISSPGKDSFLYGWVNGLEMARLGEAEDGQPRSRAERVDTHQLDTLMKVLEIGGFVLPPAQKKHSMELYWEIRKIFQRLLQSLNNEEPCQLSVA
jgi:hypothetical protein